MLPGLFLFLFAELFLFAFSSHRRFDSSRTPAHPESISFYPFPNSTPQLLPPNQWGIVEAEITPHGVGRVQFQATTWSAQFYQLSVACSLLPGQQVRAIALQGNTLLVMPPEPESV
jgi:hypothetical protein